MLSVIIQPPQTVHRSRPRIIWSPNKTTASDQRMQLLGGSMRTYRTWRISRARSPEVMTLSSHCAVAVGPGTTSRSTKGTAPTCPGTTAGRQIIWWKKLFAVNLLVISPGSQGENKLYEATQAEWHFNWVWRQSYNFYPLTKVSFEVMITLWVAEIEKCLEEFAKMFEKCEYCDCHYSILPNASTILVRNWSKETRQNIVWHRKFVDNILLNPLSFFSQVDKKKICYLHEKIALFANLLKVWKGGGASMKFPDSSLKYSEH